MSAGSEGTGLEFSFPIDVIALPPSGRSYTIEASEDERARVAQRLGLQKVAALSAVLEVAPGKKKGHIKVSGQVTADVTQACVVSLAPVPAHVTDAVSASFMTEERAAADKLKKERAKAKGKTAETEEEEVLAAHGEDPPEVAIEGRIDLGEIAVVHLALALDPYPRAPGAAFDAKAWGVEPEKDEKTASVSPFAALAKLKKPES
jgi:uncharacterized metal-binding protein YceD (DUF177 family)